VTATTFGVLASGLTVEAVEWLDPKRVAAGAFTFLVGDGGQGKSLVGVHACARVTRGEPIFPGGTHRDPRSVVVVTTEDDERSVLVPRLVAAGADLDKVVLVSCVDKGLPTERDVLLPQDWENIREAIRQNREGVPVALVYVDPLFDLIDGRYNPRLVNEARAAMRPGKRMIQEERVALLSVIHLNSAKNGGGVHDRVSQGRHWADIARFVLAVGPEDDHVALALGKDNYGPAPTLPYRVVGRTYESVGLDPALDPHGIGVGAIEWLDQPSDARAHDLLAPAHRDPEEREAASDAEAYVATLLAQGPVNVPQTLKAIKGQDLDITERALRRALGKLATRETNGYQGAVLWHKKANGHHREPVPGPDRSVVVCANPACGLPVSLVAGEPCRSCGTLSKKRFVPEAS
jgi:hypothetical protein